MYCILQGNVRRNLVSCYFFMFSHKVRNVAVIIHLDGAPVS